MKRVGLFVDGANMFYAQRNARWHIDWKKVFYFYTDNRDLYGAFYFTATPSAENPEQVRKYRGFRAFLIHTGYQVIDKEVRIMRDSKEPPSKLGGIKNQNLTAWDHADA